jgi:hypothetical protein
MAVAITPKFTKADIRKMIGAKKEAIKNAVLLNLQRVGEIFVRQARLNDTYKDRTGNLRSSIGYVVLYNGQQLYQNFESKGGGSGVDAARGVIEDVKSKFPTGFVLIGCAGMDYAAAVEAKGYDVITASSIEAETNLKVAIERIKGKTK